jgi:D-alanyl-D-alanine carboxypeptidase
MGAGLKKNGTRAFVAVTAVCAALSPAALAAVGGVSAERREDATASRLVRVAPAPVVQAADGVLDAGAPGVAVQYRDAREPSTSWSVRRGGGGDIAEEAPVAPGASFRIGSVTKTYLATAVLGAVGEGQLSLDDTLARWLPGVLPRLDEGAITVRMLLDHTSGVPDPRRGCSPTRSCSARAR